jgi:CheY-like chemotaxis protein
MSLIRKSPLCLRPSFTTGEVARWLGVQTWTVIDWIDSGKILGRRAPARGSHRYVPRRVVVDLLRQRNIRVPGVWPEEIAILVVDDDPRVAPIMSAKFKLSAVPFTVVAAGSVAQALRILAREPPPAAIVLDWLFKDQKLQGEDAVHAIRSDPRTRRIPILIVTGFDPHRAVLTAEKYGLPHPIGKPMPLETLKDALWPLVFGHDPRGDKGLRHPLREMIPAKRPPMASSR